MARQEQITVRAGELQLAGTLTLPDAPADASGRYPNVLLLPSWLPRDRDGAWDVQRHAAWFEADGVAAPGLLARMAGALANENVASLRCDPRGCGRSEGSWEEASLFARIDDARDMLAAMRSHPALDLRRAAILGHGEGAGTAIAVAIPDPAVSALTLIGPAARSWRTVLRSGSAERGRTGTDRRHRIVAALDRAAEELIERAQRHEPSATIRLEEGSSVTLWLAAMEQAIGTPALALATMLHRSVTLVSGDRDAWAAPAEARLLADALVEAGNAPRLVEIAGAGHELAEASDAEMAAIAADLAARIEPRELPPVLLAIEEMG
ncbi:MAG TPA: alpha/beta hydrolase [Candidatus Limnocylindria bacterium]